MQFVLIFIETGFINIILSKINFISSKFLLSAICSLIFLQSKGGKRQTLWLENRKTFVSCFAIIFSIKTPWESARYHRCFKKRTIGLENLMFRKCYFQIQEKSLTGIIRGQASGLNSGGSRLVAGLKSVVEARINRCNQNQSQLGS